jgi:hypothetical protein
MDLEPNLKDVDQESGCSDSSWWDKIDSDDEGIDPANRAFCKLRRSEYPKSYDYTLFEISNSCGCALCRLYCTIDRLARIGPALWRMGRGEVKTRLLEIGKKAPRDHVHISFKKRGWKIKYGTLHVRSVQFFQIEGMLRPPIQHRPPLILLQHIHLYETYLFSKEFWNLLVLIRAFGLRKIG